MRIRTYWGSADSLRFIEDTHHWASSSSRVAECSFEPGTPSDVGIAVSNELSMPFYSEAKVRVCKLQILGKTRTPFAVCRHPLLPSVR